jgi:hypothetical protein
MGLLVYKRKKSTSEFQTWTIAVPHYDFTINSLVELLKNTANSEQYYEIKIPTHIHTVTFKIYKRRFGIRYRQSGNFHCRPKYSYFRIYHSRLIMIICGIICGIILFICGIPLIILGIIYYVWHHFHYIWHHHHYTWHQLRYVWHIFIIFGIFSLYFTCFLYICHISIIFGIFSLYFTCCLYIWHISIIFGIFSLYFTCCLYIWHISIILSIFSLYFTCCLYIWHISITFSLYVARQCSNRPKPPPNLHTPAPDSHTNSLLYYSCYRSAVQPADRTD